MDNNVTSNIQYQGRPDYALPYRTGKSERPLTKPFAPRNLDVTSPYLIGVLDIRWDNPATYFEHNGLQVLGVNVYRATDSPEALYTKINLSPVSSLYYRDQTTEVTITGEDEMGSITPGNNPRGEWVFRTKNFPIVIQGANGTPTNSVDDVILEVDTGDGNGYQRIPAYKVKGETGEVWLNTNRIYDPHTNRFVGPYLPNMLTGGVRCTYKYTSVVIASNINRKLYYKVTTVALDPSTGITLETPLNEVEAKSPYDMERVDYIWAEAIRRNRWVLEQGGERVKLFLRKWNGVLCSCYDSQTGYSKRIGIDKGSCPICYGTSYVGGYEGPFDSIIAPPETEKSVNLMDVGLHVTYDWQTWTGPYPFLNDRDFVVRQNNDRFYVSHVNAQGGRGATFQQHFNLTHIDQTDTVYHMPITGGVLGTPDAWNAYRGVKPSDAAPVIPDKPELAPGKITGRTVTFENIVY